MLTESFGRQWVLAACFLALAARFHFAENLPVL